VIEHLYTLVDDTGKAALADWLKSPSAYYVTAPAPTSTKDISVESWTVVVSSSVAHAEALAWTGTVPMTPDGSQSGFLIAELRLTLRRPATT
jgi:hypothetical protein